ncbi:MAG TPA: hypothetical protein VGP72_29785 [Planctomycetota bacterium]
MPGPDLLVRYLNAYLHARPLSDLERPWGLGDGLDSVCGRLSEAANGAGERLNRVVSELSETERSRIAEALAPLIFALPLRTYPAELRAERAGERLVLSLRHLEPHNPAPKAEHCGVLCEHANGKKVKERNTPEYVGHLPVGLTVAFAAYLRRVLNWPEEQRNRVVTVSSGGRRRRVRVTILARNRGIVVRFLERLPSPADEA